MKTVYLINQQDGIEKGIIEYLEVENYNIKSFKSLRATYIAVEKVKPDIIILDLTAEDGSGFSFLKNIREKYSFPIIILTERNNESDRILAFELGCDDYVTIPFSYKELSLRVNAVLRRTEDNNGLELSWNREGNILSLDQKGHIFSLNGNALSLTASEWKILFYLVKSEGRLISRENLVNICFSNTLTYDRTVDSHIKNIRAKIGKDWIETVRGYGYKFVAFSSSKK